VQVQVVSWLTLVIDIVEGSGENLERTGHVHEVEVGMQGEQDVDRLVRHCRPLRSHLDDLICSCLGGFLRCGGVC
jgi:hypothetical protein